MAELSSRTKGRRPKHDWHDKKDICYKLYVDEKRQISEIVKHFATELGLDETQVPAARDFSRQFVRWGFPHRRKKLAPEEEVQLIERVRQLWAANHVQKQILDTVLAEGWDVDELFLGRLRRKHGLVMRVANGFSSEHMGPGSGKKRKSQAVDDSGADISIEAVAALNAQLDQSASEPAADPLPEEAARRAQRMLELQAHSDTQLHAKKRRRRIRGLAHLPPDAPGLPPRYKSETSLDECKAFLSLSNEDYKQVRQQFEDICRENGMIKKTECQPGDWQRAKDQLVRSSIHLSAVLNPLHDNLDERQNALEVICSDVTKRMRNLRTRIFLKDANNILGLNPEQSKELRRQFYEILKADNFQTMLLCGKKHWEELRQQWLNNCPQAQELYAQGLNEEKKKCVDVLLRDAMKRHNDNNVLKIPHMVRAGDASYGPGPGPARRAKNTSNVKSVTNEDNITRPPALNRSALHHNSNVDPALYALQTPSMAPMMDPAPVASPLQSQTQSLPAYFRLSPESRVINHSKIWLVTLPERKLAVLQRAATSKSPGAKLRKVSGIVKGVSGVEDRYQIDGDDELEAYLDAIAETADGKATFLVVLDPADA